MEELEEIEEMPKLLLKQGKKRKGALITPEKEKENQEPEKRVIKLLPKPIKANIPSPLPPFSNITPIKGPRKPKLGILRARRRK